MTGGSLPVLRPDDERSTTLPGLVNLHDHLRSFLPPTAGADSASLAEVVTMAADVQAVADPDDYYALTAVASARQVLAGTTTVVDHVYPLHRPGLLDAVVAAYDAVGIRGVVALGIMTNGRPDLCASVDDAVSLARSLPTSSPVRYLAPVSLRQNVIEDYAQAAAAAADLGLGLYTHIAETPGEVDECLARHGRRPVELLADQGFLGPRTVLVHAICLSDHEIRLLADSQTTVVYCPSNHAKLAKPVARVVDLLAAGVRVTLGVDGMESLFHEMRQAVGVQAQAAGRTGVLPTATALELATRNGVAALEAAGVPGGFADQDSVSVDLWSPSTQPLADPAWTVVHRAVPRDVRDVTVAGQAVVRDGRLVRTDVNDLVRAARETTSRLIERAGSAQLRIPTGSGSQ